MDIIYTYRDSHGKQMKFSLLLIPLLAMSCNASANLDKIEVQNLCVSSAVLVRGAVDDASIITSMISSGQNQRARNTASKLGNGQGGNKLLVSNEQYRDMVAAMVGDPSILKINSGGFEYSSVAIQYMSGQYEENCMKEPEKYIINYEKLINHQ